MKTKLLFLLSLFITITISSQHEYEPNDKNPFGLLNPDAPKETADYAELIGECDCKSISKNKDGEWATPVDMVWRFKYIMNGIGVQDETIKSDFKNSGSIRQYNKDSAQWYVHYYTNVSAVSILPSWSGSARKGNEINLYKDQTAPNGMAGNYKIRFYDISEKGFKWLGAWVTKDESFVYENWKIECVKRNEG